MFKEYLEDRELFLSNNNKFESIDEYQNNYFDIYKVINNNTLDYLASKSDKLIFRSTESKPPFLISIYFDALNMYKSDEIKIAKLLSKCVTEKKNPHILLPYTAFTTDIKPFVNLVDEEVVGVEDEEYKKMMEKYYNNKYIKKNIVTVIISEYATEGPLLNFIKNNHGDFTIKMWKVLLFQVMAMLLFTQLKLPSLYNNFTIDNILLTKTKKNHTYQYCIPKQYYIPNIDYQIKLWCFDLKENNHLDNKCNGLHNFVDTLINELIYMPDVPLIVVEFFESYCPI